MGFELRDRIGKAKYFFPMDMIQGTLSTTNGHQGTRI
jgi:hypothetical protein